MLFVGLHSCKFMIPDLFFPEATTLFILESPHIEELVNGYPASGQSGREMSGVILGRSDIPLSLAIKHPCISTCLGIPVVRCFGLMNASLLPLQKMAYSGNFVEEMPLNIDELVYLREDLQKKKRTRKKRFDNSARELAQCQIFDSFELRLNKYLTEGAINTLIPCGHLSSYFLGWYFYVHPRQRDGIYVMENVPHPAATNGWSKLDAETIERMRSPLVF